MALAIGIDLGGTGIGGALVNRQGQILYSLDRPTEATKGPDHVLRTMFDMIHRLLDAAPEQVVGIGMGIPGLLDRQTGYSISSPNLKWYNLPVLEPFRREFNLPVALDNDVRVGALGELYFGAGRHFRSFLFTALGTGIGSGIVLDRQVYRGPYNTAGEFGHILIQPDGPQCGCGAHGCLEALCSGPAIARRTLAALAEQRDGGASSLRRLPPEQVNARTLAAAAQAGDAFALALWAEIGRDFGRGVQAYYNLMGPEAIVVGGGVSLAGDLLLEPARRFASTNLMAGLRERVQLVQAELGDECAMVGAATLVPGFMA